MRSSSGEYFIALDHVRALAMLVAFAWHFLHGPFGPVPHDYAPAIFPLALLDEGHTGVAIFMTLSGYLFAKLLDGRQVRYGVFFWNRFVRLAPLLIAVVGGITLYKYFTDPDFGIYLSMIKRGWIEPTLPNGAWSVVIEMHFYLLLPIVLFLFKRSRFWLLSIVLLAILLRLCLYDIRGEIQTLSYFTLIGRIDQFMLGILAFGSRTLLRGRHWLAGAVAVLFLGFYWYFDHIGGFMLNPAYPSTSPLWVMLPTLEGMAYAILIGYYDSTYRPRPDGISGWVGRYGAYSYSIYLLHFFFVYRMAAFIHTRIMDISNFYVACAWMIVCFALMLPVCYLSYRFLESPFLKCRRKYLLPGGQRPVAQAVPTGEGAH